MAMKNLVLFFLLLLASCQAATLDGVLHRNLAGGAPVVTSPTSPTSPVASSPTGAPPPRQTKKPTMRPKPKGILKCPRRPPRNGTVLCGKKLACAYGKICCGKEVARPKHIRCSCTAGRKMFCRFLRIRLPPCPKKCNTKKPTMRPKRFFSCPKRSPRGSRTLCGKALTCNYGKIRCCGRIRFTQRCTCRGGAKFRCIVKRLNCSRCMTKRPTMRPKPKRIFKCPRRPPRNGTVLCGKKLACAYGKICCGKEVARPKHIRCSCTAGRKMTCRFLRIRLPNCATYCNQKEQ